jgi:hypothetical protein
MEDSQRPPWKTTSILVQPQQESQFEPELGTAQPQIVFVNDDQPAPETTD